MRLLLLVSVVAREIGVFFDPLVEFYPAEENSNVEMRAVMAIARQIARGFIDLSRSDYQSQNLAAKRLHYAHRRWIGFDGSTRHANSP